MILPILGNLQPRFKVFAKKQNGGLFFQKLKLKIIFVYKSSDCLRILSYLPFTSHMTDDLA